MTQTTTRKLGEYEVLEQIGSGGMATVFRGVQPSIGREVAIKVLRKSLMQQDDSFYQRFVKEVELIAGLQHPHILPVYDFGEAYGYPYIVMAYLRGGSLGDWIASGPLDIGSVMKVVKQVADALDYAHGREIIHRDFKPANVMLDEQNNTYLGDFGLAKVTGTDFQNSGSGILGTPDFMAPDLQDVNGITPTFDVYALGVTLFQMLTGHVPFQASTQMGVLMAHLKQPVPSVLEERPDLPAGVQQVIETAMAKEAEERYPTAGELYRALKTAIEGNPAGLLFANMRGHTIYLNKQLLNMLELPESAVRSTVGESIHKVLGIDRQTAERYLEAVKQHGTLEVPKAQLTTRSGSSINAKVAATATFDDEGKFIGADFAVEPTTQSKLPSLVPEASQDDDLDTTDNRDAELYFSSQLLGLGEMLARTAGPRLRANLDRIINQTSDRNRWPVRLAGNDLDFEHFITETHIYHALLSKAADYASGVLGNKLVEKQMRKVDDKMNADALALAGRLGLRDIFIDRA